MGQSVLFVDDEVNILKALKRLLRRDAYKVILASSPYDALEIVDRERPQVVVSDLRMPECTGVELLRAIRRKHPEVIPILMTASPGFEERTAEQSGEIFRLLSKPWDDDDLKTTLREAFDSFDRNISASRWDRRALETQPLG